MPNCLKISVFQSDLLCGWADGHGTALLQIGNSQTFMFKEKKR
jgi:hypothetical protein